MTMITPSYLGETIEYSSLHACRSTLEDPTGCIYRRKWKLNLLHSRLRHLRSRAGILRLHGFTHGDQQEQQQSQHAKKDSTSPDCRRLAPRLEERILSLDSLYGSRTFRVIVFHSD